MVLPAQSMVLVPAGTLIDPDFPTDCMRLLTTKISPRSITSSPRMVMILAFLNKIVPEGISFW